jgi:hypothetical protein
MKITDLLDSFDETQLDEIAVGIEHAFGATFVKKDGFFLVTLEKGMRIAIHGRTITLGDLWECIDNHSK